MYSHPTAPVDSEDCYSNPIILRFDGSSNNKILSPGELFNSNMEMADNHYNLFN